MNNVFPLSLYLYTTDVALASKAQMSGIDGVVVDWEWRGKEHRQKGWQTEINTDAPEDVERLAASLQIPVLVRINRLSQETANEVETALAAGARRIMLPMAETPAEVQEFVRLVDRRAHTIVQIETQSLVEQVRALPDIGWDSAYIGLNDLMICRGSSWLWDALQDGTVEHIYRTLEGRAIGFGGVTIIGGGHPLPFVDLLREMCRLGCRLGLLRRTFKREIVGRDMPAETRAIRAAWTAAQMRDPVTVDQDHRLFMTKLHEIKAREIAAKVRVV